MTTTAELIRRGARQHGGRTAILCGDGRLTFAETDELASRIANVLLEHGHRRVGLLVENSQALDLILTGRAVDAAEAQRIGLANRVVPSGESRAAAEALALEIAGFPQETMRRDRRSAHEGVGLPLGDALAAEFARGVDVLQDAAAGARRFAAGEGRHGSGVTRPG